MNALLEIILLPLSELYRLATRARISLYHSGHITAEDVGVPVISVGNITTGGTGKTPVVEWIARSLARSGYRVCILTRGYGRSDPKSRVVASDGQSISSDVRLAGDEPMLLAESLIGQAAVICDADRVGAARWAKEALGSEVFILDDGFQHLRIKRNLNILVIDATNPWGGGRLLPAGRLREPLDQMKRADLVVITRAERPDKVGELEKRIKLEIGSVPIFTARMRTRRVTDLEGSLDEPPEPGAGLGSMVAFCGVGNPESFFNHVRGEGWTLSSTKAFADHHNYVQADVERLAQLAASLGADGFVTTSKDAVKLKQLSFTLPCYVVEIETIFNDEVALLASIRKAVGPSRERI
jgi:tetraacyldisaccharide 4'-kinase